jgi:hypothetical protein
MSNTQISSATNTTGPDLTTNTSDPRKFFNNFYSTDFSIGAANDVIVAFFEEYTGNKTAGQNLAATVIYGAIAQNLDPLSVLNEFQKVPKNQLNTYLAAFLNLNRVPTSALAINSGTTSNPHVSRTVIL